MDQYQAAVAKLGLTIPEPASPVANFVPYVITGNLVYISGQVPTIDGKDDFIGKLGQQFSIEQGQQAAQACALAIIGVLRQACNGDLDSVVRCVRLGGFVNCAPDFTQLPQIINGASDLIVAVFGDRGRHARTSVGVNSLPFGVAVEVDAIFEIKL